MPGGGTGAPPLFQSPGNLEIIDRCSWPCLGVNTLRAQATQGSGGLTPPGHSCHLPASHPVGLSWSPRPSARPFPRLQAPSISSFWDTWDQAFLSDTPHPHVGTLAASVTGAGLRPGGCALPPLLEFTSALGLTVWPLCIKLTPRLITSCYCSLESTPLSVALEHAFGAELDGDLETTKLEMKEKLFIDVCK